MITPTAPLVEHCLACVGSSEALHCNAVAVAFNSALVVHEIASVVHSMQGSLHKTRTSVGHGLLLLTFC